MHPRLRRQRLRQVERVSWVTVLGQPEAVKAWQCLAHDRVPATERAMNSPSSNNYCGLACRIKKPLVVVWPHRIVSGHHVSRLRGPEREQVGHAQARVTPALRIRNASPDSWVVVGFVGRARVQEVRSSWSRSGRSCCLVGGRNRRRIYPRQWHRCVPRLCEQHHRRAAGHRHPSRTEVHHLATLTR